MTKKYRKKPVVVEAMRMNGTARNAAEVADWCSGIPTCGGFRAPGESIPREGEWEVDIHTLEGIMTATPGDYIIRGVQGEFYPCKPDIFAKTYEEVDE